MASSPYLDRDIHGRDVERLEHDLGHLFTVDPELNQVRKKLNIFFPATIETNNPLDRNLAAHTVMKPLLGVPGRLGEHDRPLGDVDTELVVKGVSPDGLHGLPIRNDSMGNRVRQAQNTSLGLRVDWLNEY